MASSGQSNHGRYCSVFGCLSSNSSDPERSFFVIPKEPRRRKKWLELISREDLLDKNTRNLVCEIHFSADDIMQSNRKLLNKNAFPCLNLPNKTTHDKEVQTDVAPNSTPTQIDQFSQTEFWTNCTSNIKIQNTHPSAEKEIQVPLLTAAVLADTAQKRKLLSDLLSCQKRLNEVLTDSDDNTKTQRNMFYKLCVKFLSNNLAETVKAQTLSSSYRGNYTDASFKYKLFCLNLYFTSPGAYRVLEKTIPLPKQKTLRGLNIKISAQINDDDDLMAALKIKVNNMSKAEKQCTFIVDAMSLRTNLHYDIKLDKITGFHEVDGKQSPVPAQYVLVVFVRGIFKKWSQPIGFVFISECKIDDNTSKWIDKLISQLLDIGLKVRAFVSNLDTDLLSAAYKRGISTDRTYFTVNDQKIYYAVDAPHLIKMLRDNLLTYDFHFLNGAVATFEHIHKFYENDQKKTFRIAHKLTNSHFNPSSIEKTKIRYATQLLSRTVASGLAAYVDFEIIDESARHTVEFIQIMNDLIDTLNSSSVRHSNKYKRAFQGHEYQIELFSKILPVFQTLKLINAKNNTDVTNTVEFIKGFQITIQSVLQLHQELKQEGYHYLPTRRLNKDITEAFFGRIRSKYGAAGPTSRQFISAFRNFCFSRLCRPPIERNCDEDLTKFMVQFKDLDNFFNDGVTVAVSTHDDEQENDLREIVNSDYADIDMPEKYALYYVCGAVLKKCVDRHNCEKLRIFLNSASNVHSYHLYRIYANSNCDLFVAPPEIFVQNIQRLENVFCNQFRKQHLNCKTGTAIYEDMKKVDFVMPCPCFPKDFLLKLYVRMRIYFSIKYNNKGFKTSRNRRKYFSVFCNM